MYVLSHLVSILYTYKNMIELYVIHRTGCIIITLYYRTFTNYIRPLYDPRTQHFWPKVVYGYF